MILPLILASFLVSSELIVPVQSQCLEYSNHQFGNSCYVFVNQKMTFWDAEEYCKNYKVWSNLATIENIIDNNFVARTAITELSMNYGDFWIGVYRPTVYDCFRPMVGRVCAIFENFVGDNPSLDFAAESVSNGKWNTHAKEEKLPFVCSYLHPVTSS